MTQCVTHKIVVGYSGARGLNSTLNFGQHGHLDVTKALLLPSVFRHMYYVISVYKMAPTLPSHGR
jgi:hypothetical protein